MKLLICPERVTSAFMLRLALASCSVCLLGAATRMPDDYPETYPRTSLRIIVNSTSGQASADPRLIALTDAVAQAANDPGDNLIEFDPTLFAKGSTTIRVFTPIHVDQHITGHDHIDARGLDGTVILDISECPDAGIIIGRDARITIAGLTIRGGLQRSILVKDDGKVTLNQVVISDSAGPGVALFGRANASLSQCRLINNHTHGLELHGESTAYLRQVTLNRNGQSGLAAFDQSTIMADDCRLDANGDWNIVLTHAARAKLTRCLLCRSQFANADLSKSALLQLDECRIEEGKRFGIFGTGLSTIELARTQLAGHGSRAIELQDQSTLILDDSRIESSRDYGLILFGQSSVKATNTLFSQNGAHGASLRDNASGNFNGCVFTGNRYSGLGCLDHHDGGQVRVTRCLFGQNGMRPIYRGPMHIDPMVPTPLRIHDQIVQCMADPQAEIELFFDRVGEASRYVNTIHADHQGIFQVDCRDIPEGWVMTATATSNGATSEFNVIAGTSEQPILNALLGKTGALSDKCEHVNMDAMLRRWKPGTHLIFNLVDPPSFAVQRYARFLVERINDWTSGAITAEFHFGILTDTPSDPVIISLQYVSAQSPVLSGRGGVTYMKWDAQGFFMMPMEIILAEGAEVSQTCPRVLAHEIGHTLGLCHARVGLLSRMQGSLPPGGAFVNDFSPTMTFYDVLALHALYDSRNTAGTTLQQLVDRGTIPYSDRDKLTDVNHTFEHPEFIPAADRSASPPAQFTNHR